MQELIKIEKRVIGAEETNSVNARDLHKALELKQQFTHWINKQISRAGLRENVDYMIVTQKVEAGKGVSTRKEYIITTDASKHIAMMSQGQKAKEVRDYFIAAEKEYRESLHVNNNGNEILNQIMPVLKTMAEMMQQMMEMQMQMMEQMKQMQEQQKVQMLEHKKESLTREQLDNIKKAVLKAAKPLADVHRFTIGRATREVYTEINGRMGVFTYYHISPDDYDEAIETLAKMKKQKEDELVLKLKEERAPYSFDMADYL